MRDVLNSGEAGNFRCVNTNVEVGQVARDDTARGMRSILSSLAASTRLLGDDFPRHMAGYGAEEGHLVVFDRRAGAGERCRRSAAGRSEHRQDGRKVVVWTLSVLVP